MRRNNHLIFGVADAVFVTAMVLAFVVTMAHAQFGNQTQSQISGSNRTLCSIRGANFNTTADQACVINSVITGWLALSVVTTNCSVSMTTAVGGIYTAVSKGGTPILGNTHSYSALTSPTVLEVWSFYGVGATISLTKFTMNTIYLSLTTAQGAAATCDVYVNGIDLT